MSNDTYHPPHYREPTLPLSEDRSANRSTADPYETHIAKTKNADCPCWACPSDKCKANEVCATFVYYEEHGSIKECGREPYKRKAPNYDCTHFITEPRRIRGQKLRKEGEP